MKLVFRQHAIRRMFARGISAHDVATVLTERKAIEDYPEDMPYPSRFVTGSVNARSLHVVVADNEPDGERIVVTVYEPDPARWEPRK